MIVLFDHFIPLTISSANPKDKNMRISADLTEEESKSKEEAKDIQVDKAGTSYYVLD